MATHTRRPTTSKHTPPFSTANKLFPLYVMLIVFGGVIVVLVAGAIARVLLGRARGKDDRSREYEVHEPGIERKAVLRPVFSNDSNATLLNAPYDGKDEDTYLSAPVMSSVGRGVHGRFGSRREPPTYAETGPNVPDKCEHTANLREHVLQSRASLRSAHSSRSSASAVVEMYSVDVDGGEADGRNHLSSSPRLTHAAADWHIQPTAVQDGIEDISLDGPRRS